MSSKAEIEALWLCQRLIEEFRGLHPDDYHTDVSGADLVDFLCYQFGELEYLKRKLPTI